MVASIRVWAGTLSFLHSLLLFLGFLYLVVSSTASLVHALAHYLTISGNWDRILTLKIEQLTWRDMVILASIPALITAVVSIYTAYERWRHWAHHAHKWDKHLSPPRGD